MSKNGSSWWASFLDELCNRIAWQDCTGLDAKTVARLRIIADSLRTMDFLDFQEIGDHLYDGVYIADGKGNKVSGDGKVTSEFFTHLAAYEERPDMSAVVHAHPQAATAFAICRRPLKTPYLAELVLGLGEVPVTPEFAMLSTDEVPKSIEPYLPGHNALLLANHGALAWGESLWQAFDRMETVEHTAKTLLNVQALGGGVPLTEAQVDTLIGMRDMYKGLCGKTK